MKHDTQVFDPQNNVSIGTDGSQPFLKTSQVNLLSEIKDFACLKIKKAPLIEDWISLQKKWKKNLKN